MASESAETLQKNPVVSMLMLVFNGDRYRDYLGLAIDSVLQQTFRDFELIIVHDGVRDSAFEIIENARLRDSRVVVLTVPNTAWLPMLNVGLSRARGKYIARLGADDIALPERFAKQVAYLDAHPETFLLGSRVAVIDEHGKVISFSKTPTDWKTISRRLPKRNFLYEPSFMYRNDATLRYREKMRFTEDYDMLLRHVSSGRRIENLPDVLVQYRLWPSSSSLQHRAQQAQFVKTAQRFFHERIQNNTDSYDAFDPQEILSVDVNTTNDADILREQIAGSFRSNSFSQVRALCRRYFRHHGIINRVAIFYLASFLGRRLLTLKRRIHAKV